jgi:hypothetical protein
MINERSAGQEDSRKSGNEWDRLADDLVEQIPKPKEDTPAHEDRYRRKGEAIRKVMHVIEAGKGQLDDGDARTTERALDKQKNELEKNYEQTIHDMAGMTVPSVGSIEKIIAFDVNKHAEENHSGNREKSMKQLIEVNYHHELMQKEVERLEKRRDKLDSWQYGEKRKIEEELEVAIQAADRWQGEISKILPESNKTRNLTEYIQKRTTRGGTEKALKALTTAKEQFEEIGLVDSTQEAMDKLQSKTKIIKRQRQRVA